jgi:hypothetical protein
MNNYHETLTEQIDRIYDSLSLINKVEYLRANYLTAYSLSTAKEFVLSKEAIRILIEKKQITNCLK